MNPPNLQDPQVVLYRVHPPAIQPRQRRDVLLPLLDNHLEGVSRDALFLMRVGRLNLGLVQYDKVHGAVVGGAARAAKSRNAKAERVAGAEPHDDEPAKFGHGLGAVEGRARIAPLAIRGLAGTAGAGGLEPGGFEDAAGGEEALGLFDDLEYWGGCE